MLTILSFGSMRLAWRILGLTAVLGSCNAWARPDLNAFLNQRATTVRSLVEQAKRDPEVMDRYRRHFSMSRSQVIAYLSALHPSRTLQDEVRAIYSVPPDGHIKMRFSKVKAGTPIFRDLAGNPILIAKCGNPLHRGPQDPLAKNDEPVLASRSPEALKEFESDVALPSSEELLALAPSTPDVPNEIVTRTESPIPIIPAAIGIPPWFFGIGIPFIFVDRDDDTTPIPEPATLCVLAAGLIALAGRRRG